MKQLYTELQEAGWKKEEIEEIPDELAWKMAGSDEIKKEIKELKEEGFVIKKLSKNKGGTNYINNIQPLCLRCNSFKNDRFTKKYKQK